jgi:lambda repressor-like predicted transcriptional regulator
MPQSDQVKASEQGKLNLKNAYESAGLTIEQLAVKAGVSEDTIKRLLGTKKDTPYVARWMLINIAKVLDIQPTDIVEPTEWNCQHPIPAEFQALVATKIRNFCGRAAVFTAFETFLKDRPSGYFTLVGEAGMGKSTFAAKYVSTHCTPCYFNVLPDGRNQPDLFHKSICQQLRERYGLEDDDLQTLLQKVAAKLLEGQKLVIVVNALDEVRQENDGKNLLDLPMALPDKIYFLLTRRPYTLDNKRLCLSPGVPEEEYDLRSLNVEQSLADVKEFIWLFLKQDPEHKDNLRQWIQQRGLAEETFVEEVANKSKNNFMYLVYLLPAIANGQYENLQLNDLPNGLEQYYQKHWERMGMNQEPNRNKVLVLFTLKEIRTPIPIKMIAEIVGIDEYEVEEMINKDKWVEYLAEHQIEGETCYTIYHASFADFLATKAELDSEKRQRFFTEVNQRITEANQRIAAYLERGMESDD